MTGRPGGALRVALAAAAGAHLVPSLLAARNVRHLFPGVCGFPAGARAEARAAAVRRGQPADEAPGHVALTFDDGPDPASTPAFLDLLGELGVRATFFVLASQVCAYPEVVRRAVAEGHEIGVHGWSHRPHLVRAPASVATDIGCAYDCVREITATTPRFWRPPHGIVTGVGVAAAVRLGMRPVLWSADGRDWRADATPVSVLGRIRPDLRPGAVVLLHDSDVTSAPQAWRAALGALPGLVRVCRERELSVGPLGAHGLRSLRRYPPPRGHDEYPYGVSWHVSE